MRRVFTITMAFVLIMQACSGLLVLSAFYANRSYIAKYTCENRFVPNSPCQGQCALAKNIRKDIEREQKQPDIKFKEVLLIQGQVLDYSIKYSAIDKESVKYISIKSPIWPDPYLTPLFHPPLSA